MRIRCTLPNAGTLINGIKFTPDGSKGVVSDDIPENIAVMFLAIPGYERAHNAVPAVASADTAGAGVEETTPTPTPPVRRR